MLCEGRISNRWCGVPCIFSCLRFLTYVVGVIACLLQWRHVCVFDAWVTCSSITGLYQWCRYNGVVLCFPVLCCVVLCCSARSSSQEGGSRCHQLNSPQGDLEASSEPEAARSNQRLPAGLLQIGERGATRTAHDCGRLLPWSSG